MLKTFKNQPEQFKFTKVNNDWAKAQIKKYPKVGKLAL